MSLTERIVPFTAGDGLALNLINVRSADRAPTREPVILVHGAGVRANIFRTPDQTTVVDALVEAGYDVWLENWRASIDFAPNEWTLDQAALYDHPRAVRKIVEETGREKIKAIIHCQGSTSFTMSAVAGLVPEVTTIVSNAVSLHPVVPAWSIFKLNCAVPAISVLTPYVNPHWGVEATTPVAKAITGLVKLIHHECDNTVCKMVSFTYGSGFPALWRHENLTDLAHEWIKQEFGNVPLRFFKQMARCVRKGNLVAVDGLPGLPSDFAASPPKTDARFAFFTGGKNRCFLAESQKKTWQYFDALRPGFHGLHVLPEYSHLDVFMGKNAAAEVFPLMIQELAK
ncbi:alpha/beta fold hydrolase [Methylocaldum sp. MU1018]